MYDLISRKAAIDAIDSERKKRHLFNTAEDGLLYARRIINTLSLAQPEQKKGRWEYIDTGTMRKACSICGQIMPPLAPVKDQTGVPQYEWRYCPACGSKMENQL